MSLLNLPLSTIGRFLPTAAVAPVAASSVSLSAAGPVGSTAGNPYFLPLDAKVVPFGLGSQPQYLSLGGTIYQYDKTTGNTLNYKSSGYNTQTLSLVYTNQNKPNKNILGYEDSKENVRTVTYLSEYKRVPTGKMESYVIETEPYVIGDEIVDYNTTVEKGRIDVNRELDGRANGGAVGDILDGGGTGVLMDANKANSFFTGTAANQYKTTSLLGEDNKTNGESVDIFKKANSDDMYVAGDPVVGGKGNNYDAKTITPGSGYLTMLEDGTDAGRKVTINAHVDSINPQGNRAFTEYGFVIQDDQGQKTTATLSGGQLKINGQVLLPGQEKFIGDAKDPVARFYYASMPGGENGKPEQRLVFESYEKPTAETRQKLLDAGANPAEVDALRSKTQATFGFRIPDGKGSYRSSAGVPGGLSTTYNGVKTYYDAHFYEPDSFSLETTKYKKEPVYGPVYGVPDKYGERPIYRMEPVYSERQVYDIVSKPIYGTDYGIKIQKDSPYSPPPVYSPPVGYPPVIQPPVVKPPVNQPPVTKPPLGNPYTGLGDWNPYIFTRFYDLLTLLMRHYGLN